MQTVKSHAANVVALQHFNICLMIIVTELLVLKHFLQLTILSPRVYAIHLSQIN